MSISFQTFRRISISLSISNIDIDIIRKFLTDVFPISVNYYHNCFVCVAKNTGKGMCVLEVPPEQSRRISAHQEYLGEGAQLVALRDRDDAARRIACTKELFQ